MRKSKLHDAGVWKRISALAKKSKGDVAVAYFGQGAAKRLPLKRGSRLVVNMSLPTVKAGLTHPGELVALLRRGVEIHTVNNLHAKVYVFGGIALIGSPNVSNSSANKLLEAALETSRSEQVRECREFIHRQLGDEVTEERAKAMLAHWSPAKGPVTGIKGKKQGDKVQASHNRTWVVHVHDADFDEVDTTAAKSGRPKARSRLQKKKDSLDEFGSEGGVFTRDVGNGDIVVQVYRRGREAWVYPPGYVLHVHRYKKKRSRSGIVWLALPKDRTAVPIKAVRSHLGKRFAEVVSNRKTDERKISSPAMLHALLNAIARAQR